jgi:hypothetical protein
LSGLLVFRDVSVSLLEVGSKPLDGTEWIADLMGNPGSEPSEGRKALGCFYFPLQILNFGHVSEQDDMPQEDAVIPLEK